MRGRDPAGFTLVEMMVSMAVGTIIILLAVSLLRTTSDGYDRNTGNMAAEREARAALTQAGEDLSKRIAGHELLAEGREGGWPQDRLGFLCLQPEDAQSRDERVGDLCAVVYYVRNLEIGRDTVRCLVRGFRGSGEVFPALEAGTVAALYEPQPQDEPIAFGVLAFEVEGLRREGREWARWQGSWRAQPVDPVAEPPAALRLRLVVARRELLGKLRDSGDWVGHPLLGPPDEAERSKYLEVYEVIQALSHES
jgi:prepilin-type N-terminal cleavage/methylation domain-containing protein